MHDILAIGGICAIGWGAWQVSPPAAFVVVGAILLVGGIYGARNKK